jgi:hypothetical protein
MYRIILLKLPKDQESVSLPADIMEGVHGNKMIDDINTEKYTPVYQKMIRPPAGDYSLERERDTFISNQVLHTRNVAPTIHLYIVYWN